ncbi:aminotransferase class I/II-fold pyridoxal phosphate-dependent enzyme [Streptosporangium sp. KLBMP 9127]|nr:aminotransferase class I/II-fold pyridoxal phosphate-dependent enzyme [Streptosporangium sp. KLBMP 9127]
MGCRFPGAKDLNEYLGILLGGERRFHSVPATRWEHESFHDPADRRAARKAYTDQVSYLADIDEFDAAYFRMPPRRVRTMDPQQRLLLDVAREAIQDAGWERRPFDRENTGVYFAMSTADFMYLTPDPMDMEPWSIPGEQLNMAATNVSQFYDLGGPSFTMDSSCSSGLVALHEAVVALRAGVCTEALVGGAYVNLIPHSLIGFSKVGAVSPTGVCRPFDHRADGFVLGEGVGVVVLRPLEAAVAAGDRVYAVIRGVGCSNDGTTDGPMTPRSKGQRLSLRRAYADAGVDPGSVGFIEAHGTATMVGDRVELESLQRVRQESGKAPDPAYVGSVKALIGHSLTASGMASLIKTTLALHHSVIPKQPETVPGPEADPAAAALRIPDDNVPWPRTGSAVRRAGINSFAFGGTNVHVVLEEAPEATPLPDEPRPQLFLFSAGSVELLAGHVEQILERLDADPELSAASVAATLARRELLKARLAVVAAGREELAELLKAAGAALREGRTGSLGDGVYAAASPVDAKKRSVAFLFPGQGSQRPHLLADLYERYDGFRATADALDAVVRNDFGIDVLDSVYGADAATDAGLMRMKGTDVCQPLLGVLGLAAARFARSCGITPSVTLGHSVGEFPAAAAAGAMDEAEAVRVMGGRGAVMRRAENGEGGGMLVVQADAAAVAELSAGIDGVWPACFNHPRQTVVAGAPDSLAVLAERCAAARVSAQPLAVSNAFHTPLLEAVRADVRQDLDLRRIAEPADAAFVSCVSGAHTSDPAALRDLWEGHASSPVRFADATLAAYELGARIFVQVNGGRSLLAMTRRTLGDQDDCHFVALSGDTPDDARSFLAGLGQLAVLGLPVTPPDGDDLPVVSLPPSPLLRRIHALPPFPMPAAKQGSAPAPAVRQDAAAVPVAAGSPPQPSTAEEIHVSEMVSLFREQVALLRAAGAGGALATAPAAPPVTVAEIVPQALPAAAPQPAAAPRPSAEAGAVRTRVHEQIARIGAFPIEQLAGRTRMVEELGFDSLMLTELRVSLQTVWPALAGGLPGLPKRPTIDEFVAAVAATAGLPVEAPAPVLVPEAAVSGQRVAMETGIEGWSDVVEHREFMKGIGRNPYFIDHQANIKSTTLVDGQELISFSSYNYLGLSGHPRVNEAVRVAVERYGTSVSASRFLSGNRPIHTELEAELATLLGTEDSVVMVSGHATNVSVIGHIVGPGDLIVHDELSHDSILQGCHLSGATRRPFAHNDPAALEDVLKRNRHLHRRALVVIEGVYSMDGDIADLPAILDIKDKYGAVLLIDEAHSLGTVGKSGGGVGDYFGIDRSRVELWSGTLSKAGASCGGYIAGSRDVVDYMKYTVPGFVYSVGMTPANAAAALAALQVMRDEPERLERLRANSELFLRLAKEAGVDTGVSTDSPVIPCIVGDNQQCLTLANRLFDRGVSANPILYPAVPEELVRLRFFVTSEHTSHQIEHTVSVLAEELKRLSS